MTDNDLNKAKEGHTEAMWLYSWVNSCSLAILFCQEMVPRILVSGFCRVVSPPS